MEPARQSISAADLAVLTVATLDSRSVTFEVDGRILRAFRSEVSPFYRSLFESPGAEELFSAGLARSWIVQDQVEGFELVVESERVPVVTYPPEWPTAMLREAGLLIATLGRALASHGFGLLDAHPWNVLFSGTRAVWVDLGSIGPAAPISSGWLAEFRRHIVVPLSLHAAGLHSLGDRVMSEHRTVGAKGLLDGRGIRQIWPLRYARILHGTRRPGDVFPALADYISGLEPAGGRTDWSGYVQTPGVKVGETEKYGPKQLAVDSLLQSLEPGRVLDVGSNAGWFAELAASYGHSVTALDTDDRTLSGLFRRAKLHGHPIQPTRMNILWPTGSYGLGLAFPDALTRLRSDYTMWLAVLHHFVHREKIRFEAFASIVDRLTSRAAIVEFIPRDDPHIRAWPIANEPWYDLPTFTSAMAPYFPHWRVLPSTRPSRQMILFSRS